MDTESTKPKWSWWDIALVLVALLAMIPVSSVFRYLIKQILQTLYLPGTTQQSIQLFAGTAFQAGTIILAVIILTRRKGSKLNDLGLTWSNTRSNITTGLAGGLILCVMVIGFGMVISALFGPPPPQEVEKMLTGMKEGRDILLPMISVSILAPISEELYFRGMVYPLIRSRFGVPAAMVLSSLFFSTLHFDLFRLLPIWAGGMGLAYFYEKTGSLVTSITAHSAWNTLMLLMMYLAARSGI